MKKKTTRRIARVFRNLSEDANIKKEITLTLEVKICQMKKEKKKEYMTNYNYVKKIFLNHLIKSVKELEKVSLDKYIRFLKM